MIRFVTIGLFFLLTSLVDAQVTDQPIALAKKFLSYMRMDESEKAVDMFDEIVRGQVSPQRLKEIWFGVNMQAGNFKEHHDTRTEDSHGYTIVYLVCHFENADLDIKVVFDKDLRIAGFFFVPATIQQTYHEPEYDEPDNYEEKKIELITGNYHLPGKLTIPTDKKSFPLAILVHGSGPNDMDETIGPNKVFRDLAVGLASNGVATLRYEKRTKVYGLDMDASNLTVFEETIEDVLSAIKMARELENVTFVVVIGHSLGAFVAPRIAISDQSPDGIVLMAGNSRSLEDLVLEQVTYIYSMDGLTADEKTMIREVNEKVKQIKNREFIDGALDKDLLLNLPPSYWLDLASYDPVETAKKITKPMLFLQGERDYQVTMEDFKIWKTHLGGRENVKMISYPDLNHLFIEGKGKSVPAEYSKPGNVAINVIRDISNWIKELCQ